MIDYDVVDGWGTLFMCFWVPGTLATPLIVWAIASAGYTPTLLRAADSRDRDSAGGKDTSIRDIRFSDLATPYAIGLGLQAILAGPALLLSWSVADLPLLVSTVLALFWWLQLRRRGVKCAELYALAGWVAPRLAWTATSLIFGFDFHWNHDSYEGIKFTVAPWIDVVGGATFATWSLILGAAPLLAALVATRLRISWLQPRAVASLAFGYIAIFWLTHPWGELHSVLATALIGFGVSSAFLQQRGSQPLRAVESDANPVETQDLTVKRQRDPAFRTVAAIAVATATPILAIRLLGLSSNSFVALAATWLPVLCVSLASYLVLRKRSDAMSATRNVAAGMVLALYVVGIAAGLIWLFSGWTATAHETVRIYAMYLVYALLISSAVLIIASKLTLRGRLWRYGPVILGLMWPVLLLSAFDIGSHGASFAGANWSVSWQPHQLVNTVIVNIAVVWIMWRVFGPGSIAKPGSQTRDQAADDTRRNDALTCGTSS